MTIDLPAARDFIESNARLLDRRRMQRLFEGGSSVRVVQALLAYANDDGGFGSALEPDVRGSHSEPAAALHALDVLGEVNALADDAVVGPLADWVSRVARPDGGVPFVVPETAAHPRGPWMVPSTGGSHLTFGIAGALYGRDLPWVPAGTAWCWARLDSDEPLAAYEVKFALDFLDAVPDGSPDATRADTAVQRLSGLVDDDGTVPVAGGTEGEKLHLLDVAPRPHGRSRALFTSKQVNADLDRLAAGQREDGGWDFDWLAWSPGQTADGRGLVTLRALMILKDHSGLD